VRGVSIRAGAVVVRYATITRWAMVEAGAVVESDVPDHALAASNPARQIGWVCKGGRWLRHSGEEGNCPACAGSGLAAYRSTAIRARASGIGPRTLTLIQDSSPACGCHAAVFAMHNRPRR